MILLALFGPATNVAGQEPDTATIPLAAQPDTPRQDAAGDTTGPPSDVPADRAVLDAAVEDELQALLDRMSGLRGVEVEVEAGLAVLSGRVVEQAQRDQATDIARRFEGVSFVDNRIEVTRSITERLDPAMERVTDRVANLIASAPLLLIALAVIIAFGLLAKILGEFDPLYAWITDNIFVQSIFRQIVRAVVFVSGLLIAVEILDATALVGAIVGTAGVAGIALGFAFKDIVENYLAGVLLSLRQPFEPNDHVVVDGWEGKVIRLTSREGILMDLAGNHVRIPNATIFRSVLLNYTRNPLRRFSFTISVGPAEDLRLGQQTGLATLDAMPGVMDDPGPSSTVESVDDSSVTLCFMGWVDQTQADFLKVRSEAVRLVKGALEDAGVDMPPPSYELTVRRGRKVRGHTGGAMKVEAEEEVEATDTERAQRAEVASRGAVEQPIDVSVDRSLDAQVAEDRAKSDEPDLLDPAERKAPQV